MWLISIHGIGTESSSSTAPISYSNKRPFLTKQSWNRLTFMVFLSKSSLREIAAHFHLRVYIWKLLCAYMYICIYVYCRYFTMYICTGPHFFTLATRKCKIHLKCWVKEPAWQIEPIKITFMLYRSTWKNIMGEFSLSRLHVRWKLIRLSVFLAVFD